MGKRQRGGASSSASAHPVPKYTISGTGTAAGSAKCRHIDELMPYVKKPADECMEIDQKYSPNTTPLPLPSFKYYYPTLSEK